MRPESPSQAPDAVLERADVSGTVVAYLRVSTVAQSVAMQRSAISRAGYAPVREFVDEGVSGRLTSRPELDRCLAWLREGDVLVVHSLSRLGRSTAAVLGLVAELDERGVQLVSLTEAVDTRTAQGRFLLALTAALAAMEAELTRERTVAGLAAARERGVVLGRPTVLSAQARERAKQLREEGQSLRDIARCLGVGRSTVHRALPR